MSNKRKDKTELDIFVRFPTRGFTLKTKIGVKKLPNLSLFLLCKEF